MGRPQRTGARKNYWKMNEGLEEDSVVFEPEKDDEFLDSEEEKEQSSEEEKEEGELESDQDELDLYLELSEDDFNAVVQDAMEQQDEGKLAILLKVKEKRCSILQEKVDREQRKKLKVDKAKKKRLLAFEEKFKKLQKTETSLNKSLASSRGNTPATSPEGAAGGTKPKSVMKKTTKPRKVYTGRGATHTPDRRTSTPGRPSRRNETGERGILDSLLNLQHGNSRLFSELLEKAITANANLATAGRGPVSRQLIYDNVNHKAEAETVKHDKPCDTKARENSKMVNSLTSQLVSTNNRTKRCECGDNELDRSATNRCDKCDKCSGSIEPIKCDKCNCKNNDASVGKLGGADNNQKSQQLTGNDTKTAEAVKKLQSGRNIKPDESDIKKPVKFAHEKLDPRHTMERVFDKLSFPLLVAGELELASLTDISSEERLARVSIAKTICYHKLYLTDPDLRAGYGHVLRMVEQGREPWSTALSEELHKYYDYRANVISREKLATFESKTQVKKSASNDKVQQAETKNNDDGSADESDDLKIIYCMEYNRGSCPNTKSHYGKFKGKRVKKWHICKTCLKASELNSHPESDSTCPHRAK